MNYGQRFVTLYRRQESRSSLRKRNAKKQNGCLRRPFKYLRKEEKQKAKEKRRDTLLNEEFQRIARRDKKAFLNEQCKKRKKKQRKIIEWERLDLFKKIRDTKGIFHAKMGLINDRNGMDLTEAEVIRRDGRNT